MRFSSHAVLPAFTVTIVLAQTGTLRPEVSPPEDPQVRAEAIRLMERANMVSTPVWPANEELFAFHVLEPGPGEATDGELKIGVATTMTKRWEFTYGAYKFVQIQNGREFASVRTHPSEPAILTAVRKMVPVFLGQFEQSDLIRRIEDAPIDGRPTRCILFDTLKGDHQQHGRACVDAQQGWLLEVVQGDETIRQSGFYRFNNAYLPEHIEKWVGNRKLVEIEERVTVREQYPPDYFAYPEGSSIRHMCAEFHRAFADHTEQPPQKALSDAVTDVRVHGLIGKDGKPYDLKALDILRPELAAEAVRIVSTWTYHPAMCVYDPATMETDFVVHFKGW